LLSCAHPSSTKLCPLWDKPLVPFLGATCRAGREEGRKSAQNETCVNQREQRGPSGSSKKTVFPEERELQPEGKGLGKCPITLLT
jgi:hypothetical protein